MSEIADEERVQAHRLWEEAGRPDGRNREFWFQAVHASGEPASSPRAQRGESKPIAPGPSGMEQTDDQDNLHNNVSNVE